MYFVIKMTIITLVSDSFPDVDDYINSRCALCNIQVHSVFDFCDHFLDDEHIYLSLESCNR